MSVQEIQRKVPTSGLLRADVAVGAATLALVAFARVISSRFDCPIHGDLEPSLLLATRLQWAHPSTWYEPYRNVGYAALIRLGLVGESIAIDFLRSISAASAAISLISLLGLGIRMAGPKRLWVVLLLILGLPSVTRFAVLEAPDVPAASCILVALCRLLSVPGRGRLRATDAAMVGGMAGLAYLFRAQSILVLPAIIGIVVWRTLLDRRGSRWCLVAFCSAWVLSASPQLIANWVHVGSPFPSRQWDNIRFAILFRDRPGFGYEVWGDVLRKADVSWLAIGRHWWSEFGNIDSAMLLTFGLLFVFLSRGWRRAVGVQVLVVAVSFRAVTALVWLDERVAFVSDVLARLLYAGAAAAVLARIERRRVACRGAVGALVVGLSVGSAWEGVTWWALDPPDNVLAMSRYAEYFETLPFSARRRSVSYSGDHDWLCGNDRVATLLDERVGAMRCEHGEFTLGAVPVGLAMPEGCGELARFRSADADLVVLAPEGRPNPPAGR